MSALKTTKSKSNIRSNDGTITVARTVPSAVTPSPRVLQTAAMFGLGVDESHEIHIVPPCRIPLPHLNGKRGIVFVTGPSGSGKSTILKLIGEECERDRRARVIRIEDLPPLPDQPVVDVFEDAGLTLEQTMAVFSVVGLSDAFVMLRRPRELSDGQRHRLRLAQVIAALAVRREAASGAAPFVESTVVLADEFGSTLDRITARTISRNLRRWVDRFDGSPLSFVAATTHDDLLQALGPEVLVWKGLGEQVEVVTR